MESARRVAGLLALCLIAGHVAADDWLGRPLGEYIDSLDLPVIYSSDLVPPGLEVRREPTAVEPELALRQVLAAAGLGLVAGPDGRLLVVATGTPSAPDAGAITGIVRTPDGRRLSGARVAVSGGPAVASGSAGEYLMTGLPAGNYALRARIEESSSAEQRVALAPGEVRVVDLVIPLAPRALPDLVVTSSLHRLVYESPGSYTFIDGERLLDLPNLADDPLRAGERLPGVAGGGLSARTHVRGGEETETLVLFDGLRLYQPFHFKDFQNVVSMLDLQTVGAVDYYSGGYPARYGDRMSAVMDISIRQPAEPRGLELGLDFFNTSLTSWGESDSGDSRWLASIRRGNLDLLIKAVRPELGTPSYLDLLLHGERDLGSMTLSANALLSRDKIGISDASATTSADAKYDDRYFWLKAGNSFGEALSQTTVLSATLIADSRRGTVDDPGVVTGEVIRDDRDLRIFGLKQDWEYLDSARSVWRAGFDLKHVEGEYDYASFVATAELFSELPGARNGMREYALGPDGGQFAAYLEHRWRIARWLTTDIGLRWDKQTYTTADDDEQLSPRLSLLLTPFPTSEIRLSWGRFYQAQEVNELQVADGQPEFQEAERAEHLIASLVQDIGTDYRLRLELYRKKMRSLATRFENFLDPLVLLPELQPDRVRIDAESATARGAELLLTHSPGEGGLGWWLGYSYSEVFDRLADGKVYRSWDQTHALKLGLDWSRGPWELSLAGTLHTGWPKTELELASIAGPGGESVSRVVATPRNRGRYDDFHRLDLRLARHFDLAAGPLEAYLEVTNLYNARNPCCLEYTAEPQADGSLVLERETGYWLPLVPSLGILWSFR